jgi:regulator of replication initiation timing
MDINWDNVIGFKELKGAVQQIYTHVKDLDANLSTVSQKLSAQQKEITDLRAEMLILKKEVTEMRSQVNFAYQEAHEFRNGVAQRQWVNVNLVDKNNNSRSDTITITNSKGEVVWNGGSMAALYLPNKTETYTVRAEHNIFIMAKRIKPSKL